MESSGYTIRFFQENEHIDILSLRKESFFIDATTKQAYAIDFKKVERMKDCSSEIRTRTPCLVNYLNQQYGSFYENFSSWIKDYGYFSLTRDESLRKKTGCMIPCSTWEYITTPISKLHIREDRKKVLKHLGGNNASSFVILSHMASKQIRFSMEVPKYTAISFISDVGGIAGIFLGISFISIFDGLFYPILLKLEKYLARK